MILLLPVALAGDLTAEPVTVLDDFAYARALSLDLRGALLSGDELSALAEADDAAALIDAWTAEWLLADAFHDEVVWQHRLLLWNNLSYDILNRRTLRVSDDGIYYGNRLSSARRGANNTPCSDFEAEVDALNRPQTVLEDSDGMLDEGWVEVTPYWDPTTTVKVCAFDAQLTETSSEGTDCRSPDADNDAECGCGPDLRYCIAPDLQSLIEDSAAEALNERVRALLADGRPYTDLLTDHRAQLNGPLTHFYAHLTDFSDDLGSPFEADALPDLLAFDETWVEVETAEHAAGILTEAGWLLRHQTNRGRANRFYGAFLCAEFVPPDDALEGFDDADPSPDLTVRAGCRDCHETLEPWAAWWGRWQEAGNDYLSPALYPDYRQECAACAWEDRGCGADGEEGCKDHYLYRITHDDEDAWAGYLNSLVYQTGTAATHPESGPATWAQEAIDDGRLAACTARNAGHWLLQIDRDELDDALVAEWAGAFTDAGYDYTALVAAIVQSDLYRSVK